MIDHLKNLKEYIEDDYTYTRYKENKNTYFDNCEISLINHCQDIEWAISELEALYELVKEMKDETIET